MKYLNIFTHSCILKDAICKNNEWLNKCFYQNEIAIIFSIDTHLDSEGILKQKGFGLNGHITGKIL